MQQRHQGKNWQQKSLTRLYLLTCLPVLTYHLQTTFIKLWKISRSRTQGKGKPVRVRFKRSLIC